MAGESKKKLSIIDGDSIAYFSSKDNLEESISRVKSFIPLILEKTKADYYHIFLSKNTEGYFRKTVDPNYKGNRSKMPSVLKYLKTVSGIMYDEFGAISENGVEADDLCAFAVKKYQIEYDVTVCSPDKDVLSQIPGKHYNYRQHQWITTSAESALEFIWLQTLMGDVTDNIKGIPGIGIKKAAEIINKNISISMTSEEKFYQMSTNVLNAYISYYKKISLAIFEFQKNFRLVYLLRFDEEFQNEIGRTIVLPKPKEK